MFSPQPGFSLRPPCTSDTGRHTELLNIVDYYLTHPQCFNRVTEDICVSVVVGISLSEYANTLADYCKLRHGTDCTTCSSFIAVALNVIENGFVKLSQAFKTAFPHVAYHSHSAKRRLLQLPLVAFRVGEPRSGLSEVYICEHFSGVDYQQFLKLLNALHLQKKSRELSMSKSELKDLLSLAQTDKERECVRYAVWKSSGLSVTAARRVYGFENLRERAQKVDTAIEEVKAIRTAMDEVCKIKEKAALALYGISVSDMSTDESDSGEEWTSLSEVEEDSTLIQSEVSWPEKSALLRLLQDCKFNWFELVSHLDKINCVEMKKRYQELLEELKPDEQELLIQSYTACSHVEERESPEEKREAAAWNGYIVSESDSDNPDTYSGITNLSSSAAQGVLRKRILAIQRQTRRRREAAIAKKHFLARKRSKRMGTILQKFPDIGKVMESYVEERSVGADSWRRTGVLTFDGNKPIKEKVTYERIRKHLQEVYQHKFSYGTVVQLCVARNKRRRSAIRYRGVAQVTSRRARKGFCLRYNPDSHWSAAFYRNLNYLQFMDGRTVLIINRDDAAGFRMDTLSTHRLHKTPVVRGKEILTTRTDFVNSYPSILQTTSYNFPGTKTTTEICAGVVKGAKVYPKNPAQHSADLEMLECADSIQPAFINSLTNQPKLIVCARVDGATDEGPSHLEVQFWWTAHHLKRPTYATLVTMRSSGSSFLNRVELQNGCLSLAHANLFIPSNINGTCFDPNTGKLDEQRLKTNMELAMDIYISRVNGAPCGDSQIHLFKGADSTEKQELRNHVLVYLKGSIEQKAKLKSEQPMCYEYIESVWNIRSKHMVPNLPVQYTFYLKCCRKQDCSHPLCEQTSEEMCWFPNGPRLSHLPFPIPDPARPWGNPECTSCKGICHGHFLLPEAALASEVSPMVQPPSQILKEEFDKLQSCKPSDDCIRTVANRSLLPTEEVEMWFEHLTTVARNRKRGAEKAAATRRRKREQIHACKCGVCGQVYEELTEEVQNWIACDKCQTWFHFECVGIDCVPQNFLCSLCTS